MRKRCIHISVMMVSLALAGCSGIDVSTDYDTTKDFSTFKTFAWMEAPSTGQGYDASGLTDSRIKDAVSTQLVGKGLKKVSSDADLLVVYHVGAQQQLEVDDWGYGGWYGGGVDAYTYDEGTLVVDLVDAGTKSLAWRGTGQGVLSDNPSGQELTDNVNKAVSKIFEGYPPSKSK